MGSRTLYAALAHALSRATMCAIALMFALAAGSVAADEIQPALPSDEGFDKSRLQQWLRDALVGPAGVDFDPATRQALDLIADRHVPQWTERLWLRRLPTVLFEGRERDPNGGYWMAAYTNWYYLAALSASPRSKDWLLAWAAHFDIGETECQQFNQPEFAQRRWEILARSLKTASPEMKKGYLESLAEIASRMGTVDKLPQRPPFGGVERASMIVAADEKFEAMRPPGTQTPKVSSMDSMGAGKNGCRDEALWARLLLRRPPAERAAEVDAWLFLRADMALDSMNDETGVPPSDYPVAARRLSVTGKTLFLVTLDGKHRPTYSEVIKREVAAPWLAGDPPLVIERIFDAATHRYAHQGGYDRTRKPFDPAAREERSLRVEMLWNLPQ